MNRFSTLLPFHTGESPAVTQSVLADNFPKQCEPVGFRCSGQRHSFLNLEFL